MSYISGAVPGGLPLRVQQYLRDEFRRIEIQFRSLDNLRLPALAAEPDKYENGDVVYADGTNWNPGSGAGFYGREAGAWVKL